MKQIKRADLHMHSTFSDGVEEPEELVIRAKNNGVELISLTDHDETGGLERMKAAAAQHGLQFANGVEISADYGKFPFMWWGSILILKMKCSRRS